MMNSDAFYEKLLEAHRGLTEAQSTALNARLIPLSADRIADMTILSDCIAAAAEGCRGR